MTTQTEALKRYLDDCDKHAIVPDIAGAFHFAWQEALAQPEQDTCKGCNGNGIVGNILDMDTCPFCKGSGVEAQPEQEPVAWRYKPARENNPRWEYTTEHPLDMGDGYLRPSLVEYCKCIEPLYAKEKPKLMLEKFREMADLLEEPAQQEPATKEQIREAIVFNLPLYTTPPQPKEPEQEPVGYQQLFDAIAAAVKTPYEGVVGISVRAFEKALGSEVYTTQPQRTEQEQQIETLKRCLFQMQEAAKDLVKQAKSLPSTQRKPLTDEEIGAILEGVNAYGTRLYTFARAIEAAHSIKGDA